MVTYGKYIPSMLYAAFWYPLTAASPFACNLSAISEWVSSPTLKCERSLRHTAYVYSIFKAQHTIDEQHIKWKRRSVHVPPASPPGTVLLPKSHFAMMILKPGSQFASWSWGLYYLLHVMSVTQSQMSQQSTSLLENEILPEDLDLWPWPTIPA